MIRGRKADCDPFDAHSDDEEPSRPCDASPGTSQPPSPSIDHAVRSPSVPLTPERQSHQPVITQSEESPTSAGRRAWARSREKLQAQVARGLMFQSAQAQASPRSPRPAADSGRGVLSPFPQAAASCGHGESSGKSSPRHGPRMPDGTRGFSVGRGKPLAPLGGGAAP